MGQRGGKKTVLTLFATLVVFSILIVVHELGHMIAAKKVGIRVEKFSLGFGKKLFGIKKGDTEYVISMFPLGGYVKLAGDNLEECKGAKDEFFSKSILKRFVVIVSGAITNYIFAFLLLSIVFVAGTPLLTNKVGELIPDYPAKASGIKVNDVIVEIKGEKVEYWEDLLGIVREETSGTPLDFKVKRGKRILNFKITPKVVRAKNIFNQENSIGLIGIRPKEEIAFVRHNPLEALYLGGRRLLTLTGLTYKGLWFLITGGLPAKDSMAGPVGIAFLIGDAARMGIIPLLILMAHINLALAVFNLLPFPILDGGHVLFLIIEKIKGKPLSAKTQEIVTQIAFYMLMALVVFVTWNDIARRLPFFKK